MTRPFTYARAIALSPQEIASISSIHHTWLSSRAPNAVCHDLMPIFARAPDGEGDFWVTARGDAQTWPLESACEKQFTVTPRWETRTALPSVGAQFCRPSASGAVESLTFALDYVGDARSFVARDATSRLPAGADVHTTFARSFERATGENATGYKLPVTNIDPVGGSNPSGVRTTLGATRIVHGEAFR